MLASCTRSPCQGLSEKNIGNLAANAVKLAGMGVCAAKLYSRCLKIDRMSKLVASDATQIIEMSKMMGSARQQLGTNTRRAIREPD